MLLSCPECELQVSDKARSCPHCGYPMQKDVVRSTKSQSGKKRLPNGFGQISEIKDKNLRNRYRAMVTVGKTQTGRPICKILKPQGFFPTYNEAYKALVEYNKNPYSLDDDISVQELYEKWSEEYFKTLKSESSKRTVQSAWQYTSTIWRMRVKDIRTYHLKACMEDGIAVFDGKPRKASPNTKLRMKSVFNKMFDYACEHEIADKNYARLFITSKDMRETVDKSVRPHIPYTEEEIQKLWDNVNDVEYADVLLIQCYSGWRPQELGLIRLDKVDIEKWTFIGGIKTSAGTDRLVPIHPKIRPLVMKRYEEAKKLESEYLINCNDSRSRRNSLKLTYDKYEYRFVQLRDQLQLNPEHRPHDGRNHFITQAKKYGVDEYAIKYIVGHAINDITEKVYTTRQEEWLISEMQKIK